MKVGSSSAPICPDDTKADQEIRVASKNSFNVVNDGDSEILIDVVAEVHDDRGNHNQVKRLKLIVPVGQKVEEDLSPFFMATYSSGVVTVTSSTVVSVSGDEGSTTTSERVMNVADA